MSLSIETLRECAATRLGCSVDECRIQEMNSEFITFTDSDGMSISLDRQGGTIYET